jgi:hypothetical protein
VGLPPQEKQQSFFVGMSMAMMRGGTPSDARWTVRLALGRLRCSPVFCLTVVRLNDPSRRFGDRAVEEAQGPGPP